MSYIPASPPPTLGRRGVSASSVLEAIDFAIERGLPGTPLASQLIRKAARFAFDKHRGQVRKGPDKLPYIVHPVEVGVRLTWAGQDEETIAAGFLHDVVEDCDVDPENSRRPSACGPRRSSCR